MTIFLGFIMLLLPIFSLVMIWTPYSKMLWVKIVNTVILVFLFVCIIVVGVLQNDIDSKQSALNYVADRDMNYVGCIDNYSELEDMIDYCIIPNVELLRDTYDM